MDLEVLLNGLVMFVCFVGLVTLHEYAHAWMACRCGDDTPRAQGRLTLDPLAHIELIGTIVLPLVLVVAGAASGRTMLFGWGRPVQVDLSKFRNRRRDDILVSAAGPAMNFLVAIMLLVVGKLAEWAHYEAGTDLALRVARFSLFLCFFNLLPIPPLDGAHVMKNLIGMSEETYQVISRFSFLFMIWLMRIPAISALVSLYTDCVLAILVWPFGWKMSLPT